MSKTRATTGRSSDISDGGAVVRFAAQPHTVQLGPDLVAHEQHGIQKLEVVQPRVHETHVLDDSLGEDGKEEKKCD